MRRILFLSVVTLLAATSCNKIENETYPKSNVPSFVASVDGADTKTVIDGMKSYWNGTEGIRVLDGKSSKVYTAIVEKAQTATFVEKDATALSGDDYLAAYPEGPSGSVTWDGTITNAAKGFWLPGDQTAVDGSYDPSTHIAVAYTEAGNPNLEFKNVSSLVKFTLQSDNVTEVCFYGNNSDVIAGNFNVTYNDGNPIVDTKNLYNLTYAKIVGNLKKGETYYISVLPCVLSKGFSIETVCNGVKSTKKSSNSYTIERNQIVELGDIEWVEPAASASRTIYLDVTTNWNADSAVFMAHFWGGSGTNPSPVMMTKVAGTSYIYECKIDNDATNIIFVRKNPGQHTTSDMWKGEWNRVETTLSAAKNLFKITDWSAGTWSSR